MGQLEKDPFGGPGHVDRKAQELGVPHCLAPETERQEGAAMRTRTKITDLSSAQWDRLQLRLQTSYDIPPGIARVCAVFELTPMTERHAEMPVQAFATLMAELAQIGQAETELAAVSLSGLPAHLERQRNAADPARGEGMAARRPILPTPDMVRHLSAGQARELTELINQPCDHGSPVHHVLPSQFDGAPPVRTHDDGCQGYGPYTRPQPEVDRDAAELLDEISEYPSREGFDK